MLRLVELEGKTIHDLAPPNTKTQGPCGSLAPEHLSKHQGFWFLSPSAKWFYLKYPNGLRG